MNWISQIRAQNPGHSLLHVFWWNFLRSLLNFYLSVFYRAESFGSENIPQTGPVLLIVNHQSFLDLPLLGVGMKHRHFHSMARSTLFKGLLGALIRSLNAFPVDQESKGDLKAMRSAIDVLNKGHLLLVFPEGARTPDGAVHPFHRGIHLLIRRASPVLLPAAVEGVWDVWPSCQSRPRLTGRIAVSFGRPIPAEEVRDLSAEEVLVRLRQEVEGLRRGLREKMRRSSDGVWPQTGAGDGPLSAD